MGDLDHTDGSKELSSHRIQFRNFNFFMDETDLVRKSNAFITTRHDQLLEVNH